MKIKLTITLLITFCIAASFAIKKYRLYYPAYFPTTKYNFSSNVLDSETIYLGRKLFYDPILSADHSISCASCHSPYNAFAHTDHAVSHGINDKMGNRNAPALFNLAWQTVFMWDGAASHLDEQAITPITHPSEMAENLPNVIKKLQSDQLYPTLFYKAFNDSIINTTSITKALAQFQLTLISATSKYDMVKLGKANFTIQEKKGYNLFKKYCNVCHTEPLFSTYTFANNGLPVDTSLNDFGRWHITKKSADSLLFKIPSIRNLSYTYPYMHDGRFKTLNEVLQHYTSIIPVQATTTASTIKSKIILTSNDKVDIIAFLLTLNDPTFVFNHNHQFPKK